ncbi:MAG: Uma2 family endonuclease [Acidobacteriota bacterium]
MSTVLNLTEIEPLVLRLGPALKDMTDEAFLEICSLNEEWRIEMNSDGDLIVMAPTGSKTGERNFSLTGQFAVWVDEDGTGVGFDSSTMFRLPNGARRSPDVAWIRRSRWDQLSEEEQDGCGPICPDFVIELRSPSDRLKTLQAKMEEYIENGAELGLLIDPFERKVYVYRPGAAVECLVQPQSVSCEPLLPGFSLKLSKLWQR